MIKLFTAESEAQIHCDNLNVTYGVNYTSININSTGDKWVVQILKTDYDNLNSEDQYGYVAKLPDGFYVDV